MKTINDLYYNNTKLKISRLNKNISKKYTWKIRSKKLLNFIMKNKKIFITGVAGFIGFHLSNFFLKKGFIVFGIDNLNAYYSVALKKKRLSMLKKEKKFFFKKIELENKKILKDTIKKFKPHLIINLAAQPGVRYSYIRPDIYLRYNLNGFLNLLEVMSELRLNKLIYASSSSLWRCKNFPTMIVN